MKGAAGRGRSRLDPEIVVVCLCGLSCLLIASDSVAFLSRRCRAFRHFRRWINERVVFTRLLPFPTAGTTNRRSLPRGSDCRHLRALCRATERATRTAHSRHWACNVIHPGGGDIGSRTRSQGARPSGPDQRSFTFAIGNDGDEPIRLLYSTSNNERTELIRQHR